MTPKERAAMQQALAALENYGIDGTKSVGGIKCTEAITALREALDHSGEANEMVRAIALENAAQLCIDYSREGFDAQAIANAIRGLK